MEEVRPWCGQPSDREQLRNRTEQKRTHTHTYRSIQQFHRTQRVVSVLEVNEAVIFHLLHALHFAMLLKLVTQLLLSHVGLEVSHVQHFHLNNKHFNVIHQTHHTATPVTRADTDTGSLLHSDIQHQMLINSVAKLKYTTTTTTTTTST